MLGQIRLNLLICVYESWGQGCQRISFPAILDEIQETIFSTANYNETPINLPVDSFIKKIYKIFLLLLYYLAYLHASKNWQQVTPSM